jgi:lipoprotein-releasing system permease protein
MYKLFMAFRYLRAHKIIYFSIVGVAVGIMTMVVVTSLMGGFSRDMRSRIRGMQTDVLVTAADRNLWIVDYDSLCDTIRRIPHVKGCAPRLEYEAWLGRRGSYSDVRILGIVPEQEKKVSELEAFFHRGGKRNFDFKDDTGFPTVNAGAVIGAEIYESGKIGLLTARHAVTPILCAKDFDVAGQFRSGMVEYDRSYVIMDLASAQEFLQVSEPPRANILAVSVEDYARDGREVRSAILEALHARRPCMNPESHKAGRYGFRCGPYRAMTWEQSKSNLLAAVEVEKAMQFILLFLIVLVAGFNIIAIYTLVVRSKTRDIGILRALGGTGGGVTTIFLMSGGLCGLIGSFCGVVLGLLLAWNLNEIADFIRVVSRGVNIDSLNPDRILNAVPRGTSWTAAILLAAAGVSLNFSWRQFYKERLRTPWISMILTGALLAAAAYFSTSWLPNYKPFDHYDPDLSPGGQGWFVGLVVLLWAGFCATWRGMDRIRRRPGWIFFGAFGTVLLSAIQVAILGTFAITLCICLLRPEIYWHGLELFDRTIYYLDRIPVFVDYRGLATIVGMTLVVSVIFSIYPALRAAAANPVEAIRDE